MNYRPATLAETGRKGTGLGRDILWLTCAKRDGFEEMLHVIRRALVGGHLI